MTECFAVPLQFAEFPAFAGDCQSRMSVESVREICSLRIISR